MEKGKRVLVGLSGGVDSSVACILLKKQGFNVEAAFIKVWQPDFIECNWREEMRDAMRVCAKLEIPFHFLNLENEYKTEVANYFINEYRNGRTPNPDVMCNKNIKFGHMLKFAERNNFDFIATGHYAQNVNNKLLRGIDSTKDQSYFLWTMNKNILSKVLFPIGKLNKEEVRYIARKNYLNTSDKKDSQGVCILGPIDMKDFLKKFIDVEKGNVINEKGETIGVHDGAILYTIGERHGFQIDKANKTTNDSNLFVVDKNINNNTITVSPNRVVNSRVNKIEISNISFVESEIYKNSLADKEPIEIDFQTRYRQKPQKGVLKVDNENSILEANFSETPAIGQSVVFYKDNECIGGGIINKLV